MATTRVPTPTASAFVKGVAAGIKSRTTEYARQHERSPILLSPGDVIGNYDASRLLMTTIGGSPHPITQADLRAFALNAKAIGSRFRGGITPQGVIDHSRPADRKRARAQIHYAVPARNKSGLIQFVTNAGPDSRASRHFVTVELGNFGAAVATPRTAGQMADYLTRGKVKIECDCPHWRYTYRFIATVGKYNATVAEWGFPKEKNPELSGVACKHVLRVMVALREGQVRHYIAKMIERARGSVAPKTASTTAGEARTIIQAQTETRSPISASAKKTAASKSAARLRAVARRAIESAQAKQTTTTARARNGVQNLLHLGAITQKQADRLLAKIK